MPPSLFNFFSFFFWETLHAFSYKVDEFFFFIYGMRGLFMRQEQLYLMGPGFYNADKMCAS